MSRGSLRHIAGDRYQGRWSVDGKRRTLAIHAPGKKAAWVILRRAMMADTVVADVTVAELVAEFIDRTERRKAERTVEEQRRTLRLHIAPAIGAVTASKLTTAKVDDLYRQMERDGYSSQTIRHVRNLLSAAYVMGIKAGWFTTNPVTASSPPSLRNQVVRPPSTAQLLSVLEACRADPSFAMFVTLSIVTGARRGELAALRWRDIDFERCAIHIDQAATTPKGGTKVKDTKTHNIRTVIIDSDTLDMLWTHSMAEASAGRTLDPDHYVFARCAAGCHPASPTRFTQAWRRACARAGVTGVTLRALRHASASLLIEGGVDVVAVSKRLGHAKTSTTLNIYSHIVDAAKGRQHAEHLAALIRPALDAGDNERMIER